MKSWIYSISLVGLSWVIIKLVTLIPDLAHISASLGTLAALVVVAGICSVGLISKIVSDGSEVEV